MKAGRGQEGGQWRGALGRMFCHVKMKREAQRRAKLGRVGPPENSQGKGWTANVPGAQLEMF